MSNHSPPARKRRASAPQDSAEPATSGKRERILDAALKVFAAEGFYNAKVSQIADAAGVADGTIYLYFKSKDELLISLFEDRMDRILTTLRSALSAPVGAVDRLRRVIELHLELIEKNPEMGEVITVELRQSSKFIREYANPKFAEFLRLIASAVAEGQRLGELRSDVDPHITARALFGAIDEIALAWIVRVPRGAAPATGQPHPRENGELLRAAHQLATIFLDGLRAGPLQRGAQTK